MCCSSVLGFVVFKDDYFTKLSKDAINPSLNKVNLFIYYFIRIDNK